jgi:hypothetical protein
VLVMVGTLRSAHPTLDADCGAATASKVDGAARMRNPGDAETCPA